MKSTIFLFLTLVTVVVVTTAPLNTNAYAQSTPPPLEDSKIPQAPSSAPSSSSSAQQSPTSLGKITIQISQTEQIVIDLPLKSDNKYQVAPIK
jgi:hypothetical protein